MATHSADATEAADPATGEESDDGDDQRADHLRGIVVSLVPSLSGIAAALVSVALTADLSATEAAFATDPQLTLLATIAVQFPILRGLGVDVGDFGVKDVLYVGFMTFALWFVTFGIMLTSGVTL